LKQHLLENLTNHPQFATNTKLALSKTYQQTDPEFLKAETSIYSASIACMLQKWETHALILKTGQATPLSNNHKPICEEFL